MQEQRKGRKSEQVVNDSQIQKRAANLDEFLRESSIARFKKPWPLRKLERRVSNGQDGVRGRRFGERKVHETLLEVYATGEVGRNPTGHFRL